MTLPHLLPLVPLLALLAWAAVADARTRTIRNWLTLSLVLTGWAHQTAAGGVGGAAWSAAGLAVGFGLTVFPFAVGAIGGGDVKLMAGIGAWVGPAGVLAVFAVEAVVGLTIILVQAAAAGRLRVLSRNSLVVAVNLAHVRQVGTVHARATGLACRSVDRPLPFAVPTAVAVAALVAVGAI